MKVHFKRSFLKEFKKLKNKRLKNSIYECILQVESVGKVNEIKNIKKLTGYDIYYRIGVGEYRIGIKFEKEIVYFVVFEQ